MKYSIIISMIIIISLGECLAEKITILHNNLHIPASTMIEIPVQLDSSSSQTDIAWVFSIFDIPVLSGSESIEHVKKEKFVTTLKIPVPSIKQDIRKVKSKLDVQTKVSYDSSEYYIYANDTPQVSFGTKQMVIGYINLPRQLYEFLDTGQIRIMDIGRVENVAHFSGDLLIFGPGSLKYISEDDAINIIQKAGDGLDMLFLEQDAIVKLINGYAPLTQDYFQTSYINKDFSDKYDTIDLSNWYPDGVIVDYPLVLPDTGNFRILAGSDSVGFLVEYRIKGSRILFCQYKICTKLDSEPLSLELFSDLCQYILLSKNLVLTSPTVIAAEDTAYADSITQIYGFDLSEVMQDSGTNPLILLLHNTDIFDSTQYMELISRSCEVNRKIIIITDNISMAISLIPKEVMHNRKFVSIGRDSQLYPGLLPSDIKNLESRENILSYTDNLLSISILPHMDLTKSWVRRFLSVVFTNNGIACGRYDRY